MWDLLFHFHLALALALWYNNNLVGSSDRGVESWRCTDRMDRAKAISERERHAAKYSGGWVRNGKSHAEEVWMVRISNHEFEYAEL